MAGRRFSVSAQFPGLSACVPESDTRGRRSGHARPARRGRVAGAVAAALAVAALAGCAPRQAAAPSAAGGAAPAKPLKAAQVTDAGGIDDRSFNASAWQGLQRARQEFGAEIKFLESREQSDYEGNLSLLAEQGSDIVFAVGFLMEDALKNVAASFPGTRFAIIDGNAPDLPNCVALKFREEEGAFLAGFLAGSMTKTGAIGFVGGMESPLMKRFEAGYIAGGRTAKPDIRVLVKYVGNWTDVAKGKELAIQEMAQGADILFAAAGKGGLGVLDAVAERGRGFYAIGVDRDQDDIHPGRILTSMMKDVAGAVYETVKAIREDRWRSGERVFGVKEGGIKLSPMRFTRQDVPPAVLARLDKVTQMVASGQIAVPKTDDELQNFAPPSLPP